MDKPAIYEGIKKLETRLQGFDRVFTVGDVSAITGYSMDDSKDLLDSLMQKYDCRLKVTENGDMIYDFGKTLHIRGERTWEEWWYGVQQMAWKIFVIVFKIWIAVTLVVYFVLFLVILIAIIVASMSSDSDSSSGSDSSDWGFFHLLGDIFTNIFIWNTHKNNTIYYETDSRGYSYRTYEPNQSSFAKAKHKKGKGFVASVYDFVFGPDRVLFTQEEHEKEIASYLRKNKGIIVKPEILALGGWTNEKADDFLTNVIVKYKGDSKITENAVLYGEFPELARSTSAKGDAPVVWYWDEYEAEYKLTGNTEGRNFQVIGMNVFNLLFASFFLFAGADVLAEEGAGDGYVLWVLLGVVPFLFSALFFGLPIFRSIQMQPLKRKRNLENIRKRLMKVIYQNNEREISLNELLEAVNTHNRGEEKLSKETVESMMQAVIRDFDGDIELKDNAQIIYKFNKLREELLEAQKLRTGRNNELGAIVFDTQE